MITIVGAGMAGLLAANMLRHLDPVVLEAQDALPNNHSAVLRFSSPLVGDVLGIPFKKVNLIKYALPWHNPVADALAYARKVGGTYRSDRSIVTRAATSAERWIAPPDLIEQMASRVNVKLGASFAFPEDHPKVISTIPMPTLMNVLRYEPAPVFTWRNGFNIRCRVPHCDAYASVMVADPEEPIYRVSITGDEMIVEMTGTNNIDAWAAADRAAGMLGISDYDFLEATTQKYAKIVPIDETERKDFIFWASSVKQRAFQLGRFATWRPGLLLDDLVKDVRLIEGWIRSPSPGYAMDLHRSEKL